MASTPSLKRWLAAAPTAPVMVAILLSAALAPGPNPLIPQIADARAPAVKGSDWTMFGGTPSRNFVSTVAKNLPAKWNVEKGENILWSADLGSKAYGGPIVAGGRIFVGTNNGKPRDPKDRDAKGAPIDLGV